MHRRNSLDDVQRLLFILWSCFHRKCTHTICVAGTHSWDGEICFNSPLATNMFVQAQAIANASERFPLIDQIDNDVNETIAIDSSDQQFRCRQLKQSHRAGRHYQSLCLRSQAASVNTASVPTHQWWGMDGMRRVIRTKSSLNKE